MTLLEVLADAHKRASQANDYEALVRIAMAMHNCDIESLTKPEGK